MRRLGEILAALAPLLLVACGSSHSVPERPTWSDVEPILRANCLGCHGGSARTTGSAGGVVYRFDFFDMTPEICGEAAAAVDVPTFALGRAALMANAIASVDPSIRPRMPPAPAPSLAGSEWQTILNWTQNPQRGAMPPGNRPPTARLTADTSLAADKRWILSTVIEDPDGESVVGILTAGDLRINLDRPGAFVSAIDTSSWLGGDVPVQAVVCDGWNAATYRLGTLAIQHK